jgi:hypothetical protein
MALLATADEVPIAGIWSQISVSHCVTTLFRISPILRRCAILAFITAAWLILRPPLNATNFGGRTPILRIIEARYVTLGLKWSIHARNTHAARCAF